MIRADKPVRLAISGGHHRALKAHLFPGDGNEAVAFALCGRARRQDMELLAVREIIPIAHDACRIRTPHRVAWPGTALEQVLQRAAATNMAVVKFHSHPTGYAWFSETDDIAEAEMFPSVFAWLDTDAPMASVIMLPDGKLVGRSCIGLRERAHRSTASDLPITILLFGEATPRLSRYLNMLDESHRRSANRPTTCSRPCASAS